jgi:hypothetical protein
MDLKLAPLGPTCWVITSSPTDSGPITLLEEVAGYLDLTTYQIPLHTEQKSPALPAQIIAANAGGHYRFDAPFEKPCFYRISTPIGKPDPLTLSMLVNRLRMTFNDAQEIVGVVEGQWRLVGVRKYQWVEQNWPVWVGVVERTL